MRTTLNLSPKHRAGAESLVWIFWQNEVLGRSRSDALKALQDYIVKVGMRNGLYFDFLDTESLRQSLSIAHLLKFRYAVVSSCVRTPKDSVLTNALEAIRTTPAFQITHMAHPHNGSKFMDDFFIIDLAWAHETLSKSEGDNAALCSLLAQQAIAPPVLLQHEDFEFCENDFDRPRNRANLSKRGLFKTVFPFGNENVDVQECRRLGVKSLGQVIAPASGFFINHLLGCFGNTCQQIDYFDISEPAMRFKREINDTWDGVSDIKWSESSEIFFIRDKDQFHQSEVFPTVQDWVSHWHQFREIKKNYHRINLIENPESIVSLLHDDLPSFVWISNVYTYYFNYELYNFDDLQRSFLNLVHGLAVRKPSTLLAGRMPNGRYFYSPVTDVYYGLSNYNYY